MAGGEVKDTSTAYGFNNGSSLSCVTYTPVVSGGDVQADQVLRKGDLEAE